MDAIIEAKLCSARQEFLSVLVGKTEICCYNFDGFTNGMFLSIASNLQYWQHQSLIIWNGQFGYSIELLNSLFKYLLIA